MPITFQFNENLKDIDPEEKSDTLLLDEDYNDINSEKEIQATSLKENIMLTKEEKRVMEERKFILYINPLTLWQPGTGPGDLYPLVPYDPDPSGKVIKQFVEITILNQYCCINF